METKPKQRGGPRPGSGRPFKLDKAKWGQITCILKKETIAQLKAGADSKHFGDFLQFHLDRHPLPTREQYEALIKNEPLMIEIRRRKTPVIISAGSGGTQSRRVRQSRPRRRLSNKEFEQAIVRAT